ncbi:MAG: YibE/F family protein [Candidatus Gastranaerophilaceae bacterium]
MKKIFLIFIFFIVFAMPILASPNEDKNLNSEIGRVEKIEYEDIDQTYSEKSQVKQIVTVKLLTGEFKGQTTIIDNMITNNPYYDIFLKKGDKVILHAELEQGSDIVDYFIADIKRTDFVYVLVFLFSGLLIFIGKKKGLSSFVSIFVTVLLILFVLAPAIRYGFSPIIATLIVSLISTAVTMYTVGGFNKKSTSAILGTVGSLIIASCLSLLTIKFARLTGFCCEETMFLYQADPNLNFKGILTASMMLATLGAVMDTGMSIASSINEFYVLNPKLTPKELFFSGMNVGKDIIGTMANTLILVYLGGSLPLVLLSQNIDLQKFFNLNQVVTEISSALIGSIALVTCVPITAIIAAKVVTINKNKIDDIILNENENNDNERFL